MTHKYRILVDGKWTFCDNGIELDRLIVDLLRRGLPLEEIEVELVEAK